MLIERKKILIKFDRLCAWALVAIIVVFFISGYGVSKGIIPPEFAKFLHETLLPIPGVIAFAFHSAYGMHITFKRWKIWGPAWKMILILYAVALITGIIIFQFVIKVPVTAPQSIEL
jgi:hypothetical protein